jgi:hypothetical protein
VTVDPWLLVVVLTTAALAAMVARHPGVTEHGRGKAVAFLALFVLPGLALWEGFSGQVQRAQSTEFCLSCHVMHDYGRSLLVDDFSYLPAAHFQNNRVPRERACYTCHTDYTMFGGTRSKLRGLRHLYVQYLGQVPPPDKITLYEPYNNRECLHCHDGARRFGEVAAHRRTPETFEQIRGNRISCLSSRCHDIVHEVGTLSDATFWKGVQLP